MRHTPTPDKLRIVILYSDRNNGHEAMRACDRAVKGFQDEDCFEIRLWRLDLLDNPNIRDEANRDVAAADMVVVSVGDVCACLESFQRWAQQWPAAQRGTRRALVSFRSGANGGSKSASRTENFLQDLAQRKGMDFLCNHSPSDSSPGALPAQGNAARQEPPVPKPMPESRAEFARASVEQTNPTFRRWGINE
jgi:hypothetical protein